jgi:hypothetical protein
MGLIRRPFDEYLLQEMIEEDNTELFNEDIEETANLVDSLMEDTSLAEDFEEIFPEDEEINITEEVLK